MKPSTLSIVIVCKNDIDRLRKTLSSLKTLVAIGLEIECIVQDSASSDMTPFLVPLEYNFVKFVSQADSGIYDGMNKGAARASGSHLLFLNSGDLLVIDNNLPSNFWDFVYDSNRISILPLMTYTSGIEKLESYLQPVPQTYDQLIRYGICHQSAIIPQNIFQDLSGYNTSLQIKADHDFFIRAWKRNNRVFCLQSPSLVCLWQKGEGYTSQNLTKAISESFSLLLRYRKRQVPRFFYSIIRSPIRSSLKTYSVHLFFIISILFLL